MLLLHAAFVSAQAPQVSIPYFSILSPEFLANMYQEGDGNYSTAAFGADLSNGDVTGDLKTADVDSFFCTPDGTDFAGKIALLRRGVCTFKIKLANAEAAGAIAAIVINNDNTVISMADGAPALPNPGIPIIMVTKTIGDAMIQAMSQGETVSVSLSNAPAGFGLVQGYVRHDLDDDCTADAGEQPVKNWLVGLQGASGSTKIRNTDAAGRYAIYADTADSPYTVFVIPPNAGWAPCPASTSVTVALGDTAQADFAAQVASDCIELQAEISSPLLRRCFDNAFFAEVCNNGTLTATGVYFDVTMAPEFDAITNASMPYTILGNGVYRFQPDSTGLSIAPGDCVSWSFHAVVNCDSAVLGQTLCYSVHAYPDTSCTELSAAWSGANVAVTGECQGDSVRFVITNIGIGDMVSQQDYVIIEDDVMREEGMFQLGQGQSQSFKVPASGATWRLEAGQEPQHPVPGFPSATVETCAQGGNFTTGYYLMFAQYDAGNAIDEECQEVIGSYDPNDKQGFPRGYGDQHLIRPNTQLEYRIRFQNTGTDTAFTVVVHDTLPAALDVASIRPGPASHPYQFEIAGDNVLVFRFDDIQLVDSFTNEPASNGFVSFKINQLQDVPLGTLIQNSAAIYFDFNPAVITNQTSHEVGYVLGVVSLSKEPGKTAADVPVVYPNPAHPAAIIQLRGEGIENAAWRLFDTAGRQLSSGQLDASRLRLPSTGLPRGILWLEVRSQSGPVYFVKLIVE